MAHVKTRKLDWCD